MDRGTGRIARPSPPSLTTSFPQNRVEMRPLMRTNRVRLDLSHMSNPTYDLNRSENSDHPMSDDTAHRFWVKVDVGDDDECWLWLAYTDRDGYGRFKVDGSAERAHRVSMRLKGGDPTDLCVRHMCHNPTCVNPSHLRLGTHEQNVADMKDAGRQPLGERNGQSKLTEEEVRHIKTSDRPAKRLAREHSIHQNTVRSILRGDTWSHI